MDQSFPPLIPMSFPHRFRLGVPSYVYPADILPNVQTLAPYVDDIELVLFESGGMEDGGEQNKQTFTRQRRRRRRPGPNVQLPTPNAQSLRTDSERPISDCESKKTEDSFSNIPSAETIARLAELAQQHDLTYTVHFPIDLHLGSPDIKERRALQIQMLAIMERTRPLRPFAYILHLEGVTRDSAPARVRTWQSDMTELLPALIESAGDPTLLCVENLNYPFAWCEPLLDTFGLGACIDLGHLWIGGYDAEAHVQRHLYRTRVIHLHGTREGRDHLALTALPPERLHRFMKAIGAFTGVLTLEIFNYEGVRDSMALLSEGWTRALREA